MTNFKQNGAFALYTNLSFPSQLDDPKSQSGARLYVVDLMISEGRKVTAVENGGLQ